VGLSDSDRDQSTEDAVDAITLRVSRSEHARLLCDRRLEPFYDLPSDAD
jgi:hypothetical protein